jgi:hypothetical protein
VRSICHSLSVLNGAPLQLYALFPLYRPGCLSRVKKMLPFYDHYPWRGIEALDTPTLKDLFSSEVRCIGTSKDNDSQSRRDFFTGRHYTYLIMVISDRTNEKFINILILQFTLGVLSNSPQRVRTCMTRAHNYIQ